MPKITPNTLLSNINEQPSEYEERYVKWVSINYDKTKLLELLYELKFLKEQESPNKDRIKFLESILHDNDINHLYNLLTNEPNTARFMTIEKYARIAAMEMMVKGRYTMKTLNIITQFPVTDYQLTVKRIQELMNLISDVTVQTTAPMSGVAGV